MLNEIELAQRYIDTLLATEHAEPTKFMGYQSELLSALYAHARQNVPFYKNYPMLKQPIEHFAENWAELPFVTRRDLIHHKDAMRTRHMPGNHGYIVPVQSGGSTGRPVQVEISALESVARVASTYRMFLAWKMDMARPMFMIRKPQIGSGRTDGIGFRKWGLPWLPESKLGPRVHLDILTPPEEQLEILARNAPAYVNTLPSNLLRIGLKARQLGQRPSIPFIISVAEYLPPEVKALAAETFGSRLINILSSSEGGVIAIECPESGLLHIQSEAVLVEIIREDGSPCDTGETGELVVTPFYNFASPLIRYRSGDFVTRGPACPCGRSLPTISKIVGRCEHMFDFSGTRALPPIDRVRICEILGHEGWVLIQTGPDVAEMQVAGDIQTNQKELLHQMINSDLSGFHVRFKEVERLPLTSGGKRHFCINAGLGPQ
jgi:phenylacetate-CoA ligase